MKELEGGLKLWTPDEEIEIFHEKYGTRPIFFKDPEDLRPIPLVLMTIENYDLIFSGKLLLGNQDLPEENTDFIAEWNCLNGEYKDLIWFYIKHPNFIPQLNFHFSFKVPIPLLFSR